MSKFQKSVLVVGLLPSLFLGLPLRAEETKPERKPASAEEEARKALKIKAAAPLADGSVLLCGRGGLALLKDGQVTPQTDFPPKTEIKSLAVDTAGRWWAGTQKAVLCKEPGGKWEQVLEGDVRCLVAGADGSLLATIGEFGGLKRTSDGGKSWQTVLSLLPESMRPPPATPAALPAP